MELPLPSQSYQTRSKPLSSQRLVNLYCEVYKDDDGVLRTKSLLGTPGLVENIDFELTTPIYGASFFKNKIVFCIKNKVFEYDKDIEPKVSTVYNWENFIQPVMYSNMTYGVMSDSKHTNHTYKITETSTMEGGVYPDEQGITLETMPDYFVSDRDLPYIVKWKFDNVIKITALGIKTRLLPQNFITARFYLDEEMTKPLGDLFNNNANDGIDVISVSNIPADGVETDTIYLAILSMDENVNSSCSINLGSSYSWDLDLTNITTGILHNSKGVYEFDNKLFTYRLTTSSNKNSYYYSTDTGVTWTETQIPDSGFAGIGFACNNSIIIACPNSNQDNYYTSANGTSWTARNLPSSVTIDGRTISRYYPNNIYYVNGYFIIQCYGSSSSNKYTFVLYSTNGTSWTVGSDFYQTTTSYNSIEITSYSYDSDTGYYYFTYYNPRYDSSFACRSLTPYTFSGANYEEILIGDKRATWIVKHPVYDIVTVGSLSGTYVWNLSSSYVNNLDSYSTRHVFIYKDQGGLVAIGVDGIIYYDENSISEIINNDKAYIMGIIPADALNETFYAFTSGTRAYGDYTLKTEKLFYIKLDDLTVSGEVRGEPITTITRKYRQLGVFEDLSSYVDMVDDGDHLFILNSNGKGYYVEENEDGVLELKEVQDDIDEGFEYQKLKSVCYLAGRFVGVDYSAGTIRWTEILNPDGWNALNYIQSETSINELTAIRSNTREAWVFSPKNIEVYTPTGSADSPSAFARVSGAYIDKGCKYKNCIAMNQNMFYWVSTDGCIYRNNGYNAERISTVALENEIMNYGEQEDILGQIYTQAGHTFYIVKFKTSKKTWCYDISTGLWHERESNDSEWKGDLIISAWNHTYVSDKDKSILYDLDLDVGTDNGEVIKREFVFPTIKNEELRTFHRRLEIDMDTGFSNKENLFLQYSDDGGYTWSNEYWVNLGEKAEYNRKLEWRRLGSAITRIYRVKMSTINKVNIIGAYIDIKKGIA